MITPNEAIDKLHNAVGPKGRTAFLSAFVFGLLTHLFILVRDIPNHDGLASMYFDQNMITSGRWFLAVACGPTSFYSLPWLIGLLSLVYISLAAVAVRAILNIENPLFIVLSAGILSVFPSLASNFAYVFTMDGYMFGMLMCVLAVWAAGLEGKLNWLLGAIFLALGMGCYQAYIAVTMILCLYKAGEILLAEAEVKTKSKAILKYAGMGVAGVALYYVLLKILLAIQGKELDTYQGINGMSSGNGLGIFKTIKTIYSDFFAFTLGSRVVISNVLTGIALLVILILSLLSFIKICKEKDLFKKPLFYVFVFLFAAAIPVALNGILLISADVNYHVLMRYQWAFLILTVVSVAEKGVRSGKYAALGSWILLISMAVVCLSYGVTDNIAYFNLQKKYEKTYAYCLRLADRIEETEGYYEGIPIAMVGVVGNESFPPTDITEEVTKDLLGISGDYLIYKSENYGLFFKHYLGITFNMVSSDEVVDFYDEDFYANMSSFPGEDSVLLHDGVIYVKTENRR